MLKVLTSSQIRALDAYTIEKEPILSIDLMERACRAFFNWFITHIQIERKVGVVCGPGNNGGDGLGIARLLIERGYKVKVWIVKGSIKESEDFKTNLKRLNGKTEIAEIVTEADQGLFTGLDILIDAIFGSGISRPVEGIFAQAIRCLNKCNAIRIAVDIPSGLMPDNSSGGEIVRAHYTVSFQVPKLAFFLPQSYPFTGEWVLVDVGLNRSFIREQLSPYHFFQHKDAKKLLKPRGRFDHKGTFGHALLIAGSYGKMGAAVLSSRAALRSGLGLLTVHVPVCGYNILQTSVPEAMVDVDLDNDVFTSVPELDKFTTLGIGPGLGQDALTMKAFRQVLENFKRPVVIDADALNMLGSNREMQSLIPEGSILTPHPKEFERLAGESKNDFDRLEKLRKLSGDLKSFIILKGGYTAIASPEGKVYFNSSGNPGMATGGTGDVLTGILTGLLAQGFSSENCCLLGVYLHGMAGDIGANERGMESLIASDLIEMLPFAYKKLKRE